MATYSTGAAVSVVLFNYRKVLDLIDHHLLADIILKLDIPRGVRWVLDFLSNWKQHVKLGSECLSEKGQVPAGVPQGTKCGPRLFLPMTIDLKIPDISMWKYIDNTTIAEIAPCGEVSHTKSVDECSYCRDH